MFVFFITFVTLTQVQPLCYHPVSVYNSEREREGREREEREREGREREREREKERKQITYLWLV